MDKLEVMEEPFSLQIMRHLRWIQANEFFAKLQLTNEFEEKQSKIESSSYTFSNIFSGGKGAEGNGGRNPVKKRNQLDIHYDRALKKIEKLKKQRLQ